MEPQIYDFGVSRSLNATDVSLCYVPCRGSTGHNVIVRELRLFWQVIRYIGQASGLAITALIWDQLNGHRDRNRHHL